MSLLVQETSTATMQLASHRGSRTTIGTVQNGVVRCFNKTTLINYTATGDSVEVALPLQFLFKHGLA